ncbi:hypothetical protein HY065_03150 [Candidatus Berkelbacteria bacterium]|nr:hypothetical protein [Candidatus Berkelbacteria bacterium]
MVLFIGPSSFEHYWHGGSIFFGLFASLMLLMHSQIAWQKRFALGLFCASLVGGLLFFVLIVHESIAAG